MRVNVKRDRITGHDTRYKNIRKTYIKLRTDALGELSRRCITSEIVPVANDATSLRVKRRMQVKLAPNDPPVSESSRWNDPVVENWQMMIPRVSHRQAAARAFHPRR